MRKKQYYHIAENKHTNGHVFKGSGKRPLQDRWRDVEDIFERRRPKSKDDRGNSVYLREDKEFSKVGGDLRRRLHTHGRSVRGG